MSRLGLNPTGAEAVSRVTTVSTGDLYLVTVSVCYRTKGGRVIGEDANLNGTLNTGEDKNGNYVLDSPIQLTTYVAKK